MPKAYKVINTRDCVFDETSFYQPDMSYDLIDDQSGATIEPLESSEFNLVITEANIQENIEEDPYIIPNRPLSDDTDLLSDTDTQDTHEDKILGDLPLSL